MPIKANPSKNAAFGSGTAAAAASPDRDLEHGATAAPAITVRSFNPDADPEDIELSRWAFRLGTRSTLVPGVTVDSSLGMVFLTLHIDIRDRPLIADKGIKYPADNTDYHRPKDRCPETLNIKTGN